MQWMRRPAWIAFVALLSAGAGCSEDEKKRDDAAEEEEPKKPKKRVKLFGQVMVGNRVVPAFPLEKEKKPARWHYRVRFRGDDVVAYERVSPSGVVHATTKITKTEDGLKLRYLDGHDIELERQELNDGLVTSRQRDGATAMRGCEMIKEEHDDEGRVVLTRCLDRWSKAIADVDGCHQEARSYDERHALVSTRCLDADGKPVDDRYDTHERKYTHGKRGEELTVTFTKASGEHSNGCATIAYDYDDALNRIGERCLDESGTPIAFLRSKAVRVVVAYDDQGCEVKRTYADADGKAATRAGIAGIRYERNPLCEATLEESLDLDGKLVAPRKGAPARVRMSRDDEGLLLERRCFGADEKPAACREVRGVATVVRYAYDDRGRMVSSSGFDAEDEPVRHDADYPHLWKRKRDDKGRVIEQSFFDEKLQPALALKGVHATVTEYDDVGLIRSISTRGIDGELVLPATHCAVITFERNDEHQLTGMRCLGTDRKLHRSRLIYAGVHWKGAASLEVVRDGAKVKNILRSAQGAKLETIDCSVEGTACMD
jgi:hypothetical protein